MTLPNIEHNRVMGTTVQMLSSFQFSVDLLESIRSLLLTGTRGSFILRLISVGLLLFK